MSILIAITIVYLGLIIAALVLNILGAILSCVLKLNGGRYCFHFSWCLMAFLMLLGFFLSTMLFPISAMFLEVCEVFETALTNENYFDNILDKNPSISNLKFMKICLEDFKKTGNFLNELGIEENLKKIYHLNNEILNLKILM